MNGRKTSIVDFVCDQGQVPSRDDAVVPSQGSGRIRVEGYGVDSVSESNIMSILDITKGEQNHELTKSVER